MPRESNGVITLLTVQSPTTTEGAVPLRLVEPHLIGEFKYAPQLQREASLQIRRRALLPGRNKESACPVPMHLARWRPDKSLTHQDLRMTQVAGEGEGKWKKNPWPFTIKANDEDAKKWNDWVLQMRLATVKKRMAEIDELKSKVELEKSPSKKPTPSSKN